MLNIKKWLSFAIIAAISAAPMSASANDAEVANTTIPASACRPESNVDDGQVFLSNGAYVFSGNNTGTVRLYCPWTINGNTSNLTNDNDMSSYRVYYRDTDGISNSSEITTLLAYRDPNGQAQPAGQVAWSSNTANATANTTQTVQLSHDLGSNRLYYFIVTIRRNSTSQNPAFSGIDFPAFIPG
ncbi:hypothetical protein NIES2107_12820 [Nostoc carneum NIES-2107]|nr:hypothetical protein NIES2107_12820 [Nostoc carneum NIES-2107]